MGHSTPFNTFTHKSTHLTTLTSPPLVQSTDYTTSCIYIYTTCLVFYTAQHKNTIHSKWQNSVVQTSSLFFFFFFFAVARLRPSFAFGSFVSITKQCTAKDRELVFHSLELFSIAFDKLITFTCHQVYKTFKYTASLFTASQIQIT